MRYVMRIAKSSESSKL